MPVVLFIIYNVHLYVFIAYTHGMSNEVVVIL